MVNGSDIHSSSHYRAFSPTNNQRGEAKGLAKGLVKGREEGQIKGQALSILEVFKAHNAPKSPHSLAITL
jgi:predicted transposase YdaD